MASIAGHRASRIGGNDMVTGSCLCGGIRYRIDGELGQATHCHCSMCRKVHGAAFGTYARVDRRQLEWLQGQELIGRYASSAKYERTFCRRCGSTLQSVDRVDPNVFYLALGTLDD